MSIRGISRTGAATLHGPIVGHGPSSPALFTYRSQPHVVIMPMFVQWNGEPDEPPSAEASAPAEATQQEGKPKRKRRRKPMAAAKNEPGGQDTKKHHADHAAPIADTAA